MTDSFRRLVTTEDLSLMTFLPRGKYSVNFFNKKEGKRERRNQI